MNFLKLYSFFLFFLLFTFCVEAKGQEVIYQHGFGATTISAHPYTVSPGTFATHLSNSSWSNSVGSWTSYVGSSGQAIALNNSSGTPTITLTFTIDPYFKLDITHFNFWVKVS